MIDTIREGNILNANEKAKRNTNVSPQFDVTI
jgi:hypothetical protein